MNAARIDLVDISNWQGGNYDFDAAKRAGVKGLFHKATESTSYHDPRYGLRRNEAKQAGVPFGAYHFARPAKTSGATQAGYFLAYAKPAPGDMRPMLDLEDNGGLNRQELTRWVGDFVAVVERATGAKPFIYTHFNLDSHFDCPLWVARYSNPMYPPNVPNPWKTWTVWQFSDGRYGNPNSVPGVGHCDLNTVNSNTPHQLLAEFVIPEPRAQRFRNPPASSTKPASLPPTRVGLAQKLLLQAHSYAVKKGWKRRAAALAKKIQTGPNR